MVNWIGDTSAFVVLRDKENKHLVKQIDCEKLGCTISSYDSYVAARKVTPKVTEEIAAKERPEKRPAAERPPTPVNIPKKVRFNSGEKKKKRTSSVQFEVSNDWD